MWRLVVITLLPLLFQTGAQGIKPLVPVVAVQYGLTPFWVGAVLSLEAVFSLFLALPAGRVADRTGLRRVMAVGFALLAAAGCLFALVPNAWGLVAAQSIFGVASMLILVTIQAYATLGPAQTRQRDVQWFAFGTGLGLFIGPLLTGYVAGRAGYAWGLATLPVFALGLLALTAVLPATTMPPAPAMERGAAWRLARNPGVLVGALANFILMGATIARISFLPLYLNGLGYGPEGIGLIVALGALANVWVRPGMVLLTRYFSQRALLYSSTTMSVASIALLPLFTSFWPLVGLSLVTGAGTGMNMPVTLALVAGNTPPHLRNTAMGWRVTSNRLAWMITPTLMGSVAGLFGLTAAFVAMGGVLAALIGVTGLLISRAHMDGGLVAHPHPQAAGAGTPSL